MFFGIKLGNGLSYDRIRWEKMGIEIQKDAERWEKMRIDGNRWGLIGECGSSRAVANVHVLLNRRFSAYSVFVLNCL